jgi:hypothetical protein
MYNIIQQLKNEPATNEKIKILKLYKDNKLFQRVLKLTYDNTYNFYIKKFPEFTENKRLKFSLPTAFDFLEFELASRKVTGNEAIQLLSKVLGSLKPDDREVIKLVLQRDLDCGISTTTINKVFGGLVPNPKKMYMRCSVYSDKLWDELFEPESQIYIQEKMDGLYCNLVDYKFITRNLKLVKLFEAKPELFQDIVNSAKLFQDKVLQGELLIYNTKEMEYLDRQTSNGILNSKHKDLPKNCEIHYVVWDNIPKSAWYKGYCATDYFVRFNELGYRLPENSPIKLVNTLITQKSDKLEEVADFYKEIVRNGGEGVVLKTFGLKWEGKTSKYQLKYKKEFEFDLIITDILDGKNGKNEGKPSILHCESRDGLLKVNVGIGFTDEFLEDLRANTEKFLNKIVSVRAFDLITNQDNDEYSLFLPRFIEIREDKDRADTLDQIKEIVEFA